ncbi:DUF6585 family protein [Actinocorallia longicatena]|uniref:Uncharacterized protein n=1 Tax=Actinocorallia longicatena TaxID=111803 RepID=A0ABP6PY58_9ACTN
MTGRVGDELVNQMDAAAERAGLGARHRMYEGAQPENGSPRSSLVAALVCALVAVVLFAAGSAFGLFFVLIAVIAVCLWAAELSTAAKNTHIRLHLHADGLVAVAKNRVHAVRYDSTGILQSSLRHTGAGGYTDHTYKLTDVDGAQVMLQGREGEAATGRLAGHQEWGRAIQENVTRAQLPKAVASLNSGGRVDFGKLWVTREEVGSARSTAQWNEIEELRVVQGFLKLKVAGKWRSVVHVAVAGIPNFFVFLTLADQLRRPVR